MKKLHFWKILLFILIITVTAVSCSSYASKSASRKAERSLAGGRRAFRESRKVRMARKQQERRQSELKKDYNKHVRLSRERTYEIQSEEVKSRMKRNEANIEAREKAKSKKSKSATKKSAKKYR